MAAPEGICCLCGTVGPLSFEHVPPRSAFNTRPVFAKTMEDWLKSEDPYATKGRQQQKGSGAYTLCGLCNNRTGNWYGGAYAEWAWQAMLLLRKSGGRTSLHYPFNIFPLRVIKQIFTMFFSICGDRFHAANPELQRFLLDKERTGIPSEYRVLMYLNASTLTEKPIIKATGVVGAIRLRPHCLRILAEHTFPPLGYVLTFGSPSPDERLFDITYFTRFKYNTWRQEFLRPYALPLSTPFPADFRSREQVEADAHR